MKTIIISGSLRAKSYNTSIANLIKSYLISKNNTVHLLEPAELEIPLFNLDISLEQFPKNVTALKQLVEDADMVVFVTPEYNHSIPGVLKNAIDWLSTGEKNSLGNKVAAIMGVSTGIYGTLRAQSHLRDILKALNVYVLPQPEVYIGPAGKIFNEQNECIDEKTLEKIHTLIDKTITFAEKLKGGV